MKGIDSPETDLPRDDRCGAGAHLQRDVPPWLRRDHDVNPPLIARQRCARACRQFAWGLGWVMVALTCVPAGAAAAVDDPGTTHSPLQTAQMGSLQRTAASLDDTLDVYRLSLVELVPALRSVLVAGQAAGALPSTPLPAPSVDVFRRLALSVNRRVSAPALPALARAYHAEVVAGLEDLAGAQTLAAVPGPARAIAAAMTRVAGMADSVVDVFSRQRPVLNANLDAGRALDDINEALEQLALSEANINTVHARHGTQGEQLQAFLRLEIALGHALDLIAAAEEAGIHIGFELPRSTTGMSRRLASVHQRLDDLQEVLTALWREPRPVGADLQAGLLSRPTGGVEVQLQWTPPEPGRGVALLRVYRRNDLAALRQERLTELRCRGAYNPEAAATIERDIAAWDDGPERVVELPPGRNGYVDYVDHVGARQNHALPPLYRLVSVSPFGVESKGNERSVLALPASLAPPTGLAAEPENPPPDSPAFYHDADAVMVRWQASKSDVSGLPQAMQFAEEHALPIVRRYNIVRLLADNGNTASGEVVGHVAAGVTQFVDRPTVEQLARGVFYTVEAEDMNAHLARAGELCGRSALVKLDLSQRLLLASAGLAEVTHPTTVERERAAALTEPAALAAARAAFSARPSAVQQDWLRTFWQNTSAQKRVSWYQSWPAFMSDEERSAWLATASQHIHGRDEPWLRAELWLQQNPELIAEVERWWQLLDENTRKAAVQQWRSRLNRNHLMWLQDRLKNADARQRAELERPVRVLTWWQSRDIEEQDRLNRWWDSQNYTTRQQHLAAFLHGRPRVVVQAVRWPDWDQLTAAEREAWLQGGYNDLPSGLWPDVIAFVDWQELDVPRKVQAIHAELGTWRSFASAVRFSIRPLDALFDFKLMMAVMIIVLGALSGFLLQYAAKHQLGEPPDL